MFLLKSEAGKLTHIIHGQTLYIKWKGRANPRKGKTGFKNVPCTEENKLKLSISRKGSGNPNWGKSPSLESREKQSSTLKTKILNGEYTPKSNNRLTHYNIIHNNKTFRSSWEVIFIIYIKIIYTKTFAYHISILPSIK
jgi:hypothetical protein